MKELKIKKPKYIYIHLGKDNFFFIIIKLKTGIIKTLAFYIEKDIDLEMLKNFFEIIK